MTGTPSTLHPLVPATYFAGTVVLGAFCMQPVLAALSLAGALCCACCCLGVRGALRQLRWQLPALAVVTLANPLFSHSGMTTVFAAGPVTVRLEALAYGLCMGMVMVSTLVWLGCAASVLDVDDILGLGGGALPTVTLMVSMALQLVPQLARRWRGADAVAEACTAAGGASAGTAPGARGSGRSRRLRRGVRASNVLVGWAMEDSLERADAMRARGWQAGARRSSYEAHPLHARDAACECAVVLLLLASCLVAWAACGEWHFYPTMPHLAWWWGYLPYAALMFLPTARHAAAALGWRAWEAAR